jgi:hypothetical protein
MAIKNKIYRAKCGTFFGNLFLFLHFGCEKIKALKWENARGFEIIFIDAPLGIVNCPAKLLSE